MSLFEVRHQPIAQAVVQQALASGRLAHGLLMVGPGGVGKEMFAHRLGALLLCDKPVSLKDGAKRAGVQRDSLPAGLTPPKDAAWQDACGQCESCRLAAAGTHPDVHLVQRELHKTITELRGRQGLELYIDVIRQYVIEPASRKGTRGRGKVFIIRDAHLMSDEAQNALLKTLEEPPPATTLILLTDQAHRLLETIRSRCQLVRFTPLPADFVREQMAGRVVGERPIPNDEATYLAARSGGRLGEAVRLAQADVFGVHQDLAERLARLGPSDAMELAGWFEDTINTLAKERAELDEISDSQAKKEVASDLLATAAMILADAMRSAVGATADAPILFVEAAAALGKGPDVDDRIDRLARGVAALERADYLITQRFINPRLTLDELSLALADDLA